MRKIFLLAILFLFATCGRGTEEYPETEYAPVFAETAEVVEIPAQEETPTEEPSTLREELATPESPPKTFAAIPFVYEIFVNGEISSLRGFTVNGREYFRPHDIALALEGTRAQFELRDGLWGGFPETQSIFHVILHTSPVMPNISALSPISTEATVAVPSHLTVNFSIGADGRVQVLETFKIDGYYFIAPSDWGGFIGFTVEHSPCGAIFICTNEQPLSPHGLRVAEEFLRARPSLFHPSSRAWDEEEFHAYYFHDDWGQYLFPISYHLHDFNNDGIPEILINYDIAPHMAMTRSYLIYAYVGGRFESIGEIPMWGKLYRDSVGRIFSFEGSHYDGFHSVRTLTYENGVFGWEYFIEPYWIWSDDFMDWCDEEWAEWSGLWGDWDVLIPIMPGGTERLTVERRLQNAQTAALHEAVSQYHGLCYCGEMYRHELRFPTPPINSAESMEGGCVPTEEWADPWRAAYAELLRGYENVGYTVRFFLHDMAGRGIPEIFIEATQDNRNCFIALYTFGVDDVQPLEFEDAEGFLNFIRDSRAGLFATHSDEHGLEGFTQGVARSFRRYGIQDGVLVTTLQGVSSPSVVRPREREILRHILTEENLRAVLSAWQPDEPFFHTIQDLPQQIKRGDFSSLYRLCTLHGDLHFPSTEGTLRGMLERKEAYGYYEWVEHDITGNGVNDLILRTREGGKMQKIAAIFIFDYENHTTGLLTFEFPHLSSGFSFLGESGKRIRHSSYGTYNTWHRWGHDIFSENFVPWLNKQITIVQINYPDEVHRSWVNNNPEMSEPGVYFTLHQSGVRDMQISESEFLELFEEMAGFSFYYVWPYWADRTKEAEIAHWQEAHE